MMHNQFMTDIDLSPGLFCLQILCSQPPHCTQEYFDISLESTLLYMLTLGSPSFCSVIYYTHFSIYMVFSKIDLLQGLSWERGHQAGGGGENKNWQVEITEIEAEFSRNSGPQGDVGKFQVTNSWTKRVCNHFLVPLMP